MGIRLDQLHDEVFAKIAKDMSARESAVLDYLDNRVAEIDVVFGLPETTHVERDVEVNKRNLEKSGFIEINRSFVPFKTGSQADTGVWISNLNTNESPFEPRTIDGQKRGISVGGHILNYTAGNIGQTIDKMMKLPIAPNLPVFFPEDNDMVMTFSPSKLITHKKIVTDSALAVSITESITDYNKINIDKIVEGNTTQYYYMDEDSNVFYLNSAGRSYRQTDPNTLLVEPYNRFTESFGGTFAFEKIYDKNAVPKYVDLSTSKLFEIKTPLGVNATKVDLVKNTQQVYLETTTVTRYEEVDGVLQPIQITQPMLVTYTITPVSLNGLENQVLVKNTVSEMGFQKTTAALVEGGTQYTYISDRDIKMFIDSAEIYYYHPFRTYELDANGDKVLLTAEEIANDPTLMYQTIGDAQDPKYYKLIYDDAYKTYLPIGSTKPVSGNVQIIDNITGATVNRAIHTIVTEKVSYYRVDTLMDGDISLDMIELDSLGRLVNNAQVPNANRPVRITSTNTLTTLTAGNNVVLSAGKEFYYHHLVGTKYYKKASGAIYYIGATGELYTPAQDVQEIFRGTVTNTDSGEKSTHMFYAANGLLFYFDDSSLRTYIEDGTKQQMQLTNVDGYRIFTKKDGTKIYVVDASTMVTIDSAGVETPVNIPYGDLTPVFETADVTENVLNLVHPIAFNIVQGNVILTRNNNLLMKYSDYNVTANLRLLKDLEFNEETKKGDTLYVKRAGKKDIILRLEKVGTAANDTAGHWANNTGNIVMPEPLTGNSFNWTEGQLLVAGQQLDYNDVVKGHDGRYYQYIGSSLTYDEMGPNKAIVINPTGVFWEDVTADEVEYERKGQNYKIINAAKGDTIRFTVTRRVWEQHPVTGEMTVITKAPYAVERIAQQDGNNLFILNDANFMLDDNASLESYILLIENIKYYSTYKNNRANNFLLTLTGLQTVAKNEDAAMIYGDDYFISKCTLYLTEANISDTMVLRRVQAPQTELQIDFDTVTASQTVTVPFEIIKNKYDIIVPETIVGHEYTWIMGEALPEGKVLSKGDVIFDKVNVKFYRYNGNTKGTNVVSGGVSKFVPTLRESLLRQSENVQKELLRQYYAIPLNLNAGEYWDAFNELWAKEAKKLSDAAGVTLDYFINSNGKQVLNTADTKVVDYLNKTKAQLIEAAEHVLNDAAIDKFQLTDIMTAAVKTELKRVLNTNLDQFVIKKVRLDKDGQPVLDEDANKVYDYFYTRNFMVETKYNTTTKTNDFITRNITGVETPIVGVWTDITAPKVGYYRFGKTFTVLNTKASDKIIVRLLDTGAETFTSNVITSKGGEITFAIDFNIEEESGVEIPFEVIHQHIHWVEGEDYVQEGQKISLHMVDKAGQNVIIKRNGDFNLTDIVVLERKDLVFVEVWHEDVSETGYIFPFGNVQYQGNMADNIGTETFSHKFYDSIAGEQTEIVNGDRQYCQVYQKGNVVYNYYAGTDFEPVTAAEKKYIDTTFLEDTTLGRGWKLSNLTDQERATIFKNADHNLYYDGEALIQIRYRTRVVGLNLFKNYFKGTSEYMSEGLRFQGKSPVTSRIVTREVGEYTTADGAGVAGQPKTETIQVFAGGNLVISSSPNSLLYKEGKLFDDALFTVEEKTSLSHNGYVYAIPVAIVNRRNQGVYHPSFNDNGTSFFINGIHVSEDKEDFADDITGFTLIDQTKATLQTSSVGRDRKAKFKVMLNWLFMTDYKAGGSMVSKTTYRPDGLLYDEINTRDIIDLRIDANDQRKRIEDLESGLAATNKELDDLTKDTAIRFEQTTNYINTTANLIYTHITATEAGIRKDMDRKDAELTLGLETTNTNLADLSANVFSKDITKNLMIDTILGLTDFNTTGAFVANRRPTRVEIEGMIDAFVENMEGPYTKAEFMKFLVTVLKSITDKTMLSEDELDRWIRRLSVKDLALDADKSNYSRAETLELIYEGLILASSARVLPPVGSDNIANWEWSGTRFNGWLGSKNLELVADFLENGRTPVATKKINVSSMTRTYDDISGKTWNAGYIAGPTIWGDVHNYHAIYTTWIFVDTPFTLENVKMNGDDTHAIYINQELVARNKYCCRDTAYSYDFSVSGWYRIDAMYSESGGGHYIQLGWSPSDYQDKIKYMTTVNMDGDVAVTKMRLDNWASKLKSLTSTIVGDASGYFTKLETKLILIEGLSRIRDHILTYGTSVTDAALKAFHTGNATTPGLESWLDNLNNDGKFSALGYEVQPGTDPTTGAEYPRSDIFRPVPDMNGKYNKSEVLEIIRKGLQLVNGIDSINSADIEKWVTRLNISIKMPAVRYFTKTQVDALIKAGANYLAGLDTVTSYEISAWLNNYITKKDMIFNDAGGNDLSQTVDTSAYTKAEIKTLFTTKFKELLGAQAAKTKV